MTDTAAYERPSSLPDALEILGTGDWHVAAGCTDLFPATERKILPGPVLDISGISALRGIHRTKDGICIGATTTWSDVIHADLPPAFEALKQAARQVGATQIQNRGTVAGNLCNASPAADGVPPLLILDARVELTAMDGVRTVELSDFISGPRKTDLRPGELVTALHIPDPVIAGRSAFLKLGARAYLVISIAMTAARVEMDAGKVRKAALSVGACGPVATRLPSIEAAMVGKPLNGDIITDAAVAAALSPIDDMRADAAYRAASAAELLRRTVDSLAQEAGS